MGSKQPHLLECAVTNQRGRIHAGLVKSQSAYPESFDETESCRFLGMEIVTSRTAADL